MIRMWEGLPVYSLGPLMSKEKDYSFPTISNTNAFFVNESEYKLAKRDSMGDIELGPDIEDLYKAFRNRLLLELSGHIKDLVEIRKVDKLPIPLEAGKRYVTKSGCEVLITGVCEHKVFPLLGEIYTSKGAKPLKMSWTENGEFYGNEHLDGHDICDELDARYRLNDDGLWTLD